MTKALWVICLLIAGGWFCVHPSILPAAAACLAALACRDMKTIEK